MNNSYDLSSSNEWIGVWLMILLIIGFCICNLCDERGSNDGRAQWE